MLQLIRHPAAAACLQATNQWRRRGESRSLLEAWSPSRRSLSELLSLEQERSHRPCIRDLLQSPLPGQLRSRPRAKLQPSRAARGQRSRWTKRSSRRFVHHKTIFSWFSYVLWERNWNWWIYWYVLATVENRWEPRKNHAENKVWSNRLDGWCRWGARNSLSIKVFNQNLFLG